MKKIFIFYCLFIFSSIILYSQNVERITYVDIGPTGSQRNTRTVNVIFVGWLQRMIKQEGNLITFYDSFCFVDGEWSDWELNSRSPMQTTLFQYYEIAVSSYALVPNQGDIIQGRGFDFIQMPAIPQGQTRPFWWAKDGKSFFAFYKLYAVVN